MRKRIIVNCMHHQPCPARLEVEKACISATA